MIKVFYKVVYITTIIYSIIAFLFFLGALGIVILTYIAMPSIIESISEENKKIDKIRPIFAVLPDSFVMLIDTEYVTGVLTQIMTVFAIGSAFFLVVFVLSCKAIRTSGRFWITVYNCLTILTTGWILYFIFQWKRMVVRLMENYMEEYTGIADMTVGGVLWNGAMHFLECCGIENWEDFKDLDSWPDKALKDHTVDVEEFKDWITENKWVANLPDNNEHIGKVLVKLNCSLTGEGKNRVACDWWDYHQFKTPMMCCKQIADIPSGCHLDSAATEENNWLTEGCHTKVIDYIDMYVGPYIYILDIIAICMSAYCVLILVFCIIGPEQKEQIELQDPTPVEEAETNRTSPLVVKEDKHDVVEIAPSNDNIFTQEQRVMPENDTSTKSSQLTRSPTPTEDV